MSPSHLLMPTLRSALELKFWCIVQQIGVLTSTFLTVACQEKYDDRGQCSQPSSRRFIHILYRKSTNVFLPQSQQSAANVPWRLPCKLLGGLTCLSMLFEMCAFCKCLTICHTPPWNSRSTFAQSDGDRARQDWQDCHTRVYPQAPIAKSCGLASGVGGLWGYWRPLLVAYACQISLCLSESGI